MAGWDRAALPGLRLGRWAYHRGEVVPASDPQLPLSTQALHYGIGVFEGIRAYRSADGLFLFRAHDHYERMLRGCRTLRIPLPGKPGDLVDITVELLRRNAHDEDAYVRPVAYKLSLLPGMPPGVFLSGLSDAMSIISYSLPVERLGQGVRCVISSWRRPPRDTLPAQAKITGGYVTSAFATDEARAGGQDDAILLDRSGNVAEATTANVFTVRDGCLVTPPTTGDLLPGITRDTLLTLIREAGLPVAERSVSPAELISADEVFLCSTGKGVVPVLAVAGRDVGTGAIGPVTAEVRALYAAATTMPGGIHADWLTPVMETQ
ncbi:branched-chain amino acid aminotransferase [Salinispora arenicola]|uniref:aminotransferase class IV n=1 Tax=Salinispora arenicola TaxID=168697 RepID=UPI0003676F55|nr:aminotransferase class IV [Salinispora arenicola]NIL42462.1 branched-chain amino acid aminotransferase [Salinispora arenicola]